MKRARYYSVLRARTRDCSAIRQFTKKKHNVSALLGPLFIGPKDLRIRNVGSISTVRSPRSNGPQRFPPEKPLINARHVTPLKITSHLGKPNSLAPKGGRPIPTIQDSSDEPILEPGGQLYRYGRPTSWCVLVSLPKMTETYADVSQFVWPSWPRHHGRPGRPTRTTINAQTKVSEAKPSLRIR